MTEKAAEIDKLKGATLEEISKMVDQINREFKSKQAQLQPLMSELKSCKQEFNDVEATYLDKKAAYDKVAISLDMDKQSLERDCDICQEDCLREETRYHTLTNLINIAKIKLEKADMEKKWRSGSGKLSRDVASFKDCYADKIQRQEASIKRLRQIQKETKENHVHLTNQKINFNNLKYLLDAKMLCSNGDFDGLAQLQNPNGGVSIGLSSSFSGGGAISYVAPSKSGKSFSVGGANVMNFDD
jgi:intraflagellar transport protein 81